MKEINNNNRKEIWDEAVKETVKYPCKKKKYTKTYRLFQVSSPEDPKRNKHFKWYLTEDYSTENLPYYRPDKDTWISFAIYHKRFKKRGFVAAINCNYIFLKFSSHLQKRQVHTSRTHNIVYTSLTTQLHTTTTEKCKKLNIPQPKIIYSADGLYLIWQWNNYMEKEFYKNDYYGFRFNDDWENMQTKLFDIFEDMGADKRRLTVNAVYRIPGSINTVKRLKTNDRLVRVIQEGQVINSYVDMQYALGLKEKTQQQQGPSQNTQTNPTPTNTSKKEDEWEEFKQQYPDLVRNWNEDVFRIHKSSQNWVCIATIDEDRHIKQYWEKSCHLKYKLMTLAKNQDFEHKNVYITQHEFLKKERKIQYVCYINTNFLDLDYKLLTNYHPEFSKPLTPEEWRSLVYEHIANINGCFPNDIVFSGGGVHLKWIYSNNISASELSKWQYMQKLLQSQFKSLGADPASLDAARILRLPGSINQKYGKYNKNRLVKVIDLSGKEQLSFTFEELVSKWEHSKPQYKDEFQEIKDDWQRKEKQLEDAQMSLIIHMSDHLQRIECEVPEGTLSDFRKNPLKLHQPRDSWTYLTFPDGCHGFIPTYKLENYLKQLFPFSGVKIAAADFNNKKVNSTIANIPCSYVVLNNCPGNGIKEKLDNIMKKCSEYRDVGIPYPNQIIREGKTFFVEWIYNEDLPGYAFPRWQVTQEFLAHHFKDWGAMSDVKFDNVAMPLPVPGIIYNGEYAHIDLYEPERLYSFNFLASKVLHFTQEEVRQYKARKLEEQTERREYSKKMFELNKKHKTEKSRVRFTKIAEQRFNDIMTLLEMRKDNTGNAPEGKRELCVFYALISAIQARLVNDTDEIYTLISKLIEFCGPNFKDDCEDKIFGTVIAKFLEGSTVIYKVKNSTLVKVLDISEDEQKQLTVLKNTPRESKQHEPRESWLAQHSTEREKPWLAFRISRATWYRLRKMYRNSKVA